MLRVPKLIEAFWWFFQIPIERGPVATLFFCEGNLQSKFNQIESLVMDEHLRNQQHLNFTVWHGPTEPAPAKQHSAALVEPSLVTHPTFSNLTQRPGAEANVNPFSRSTRTARWSCRWRRSRRSTSQAMRTSLVPWSAGARRWNDIVSRFHTIFRFLAVEKVHHSLFWRPSSSEKKIYQLANHKHLDLYTGTASLLCVQAWFSINEWLLVNAGGLPFWGKPDIRDVS